MPLNEFWVIIKFFFDIHSLLNLTKKSIILDLNLVRITGNIITNIAKQMSRNTGNITSNFNIFINYYEMAYFIYL